MMLIFDENLSYRLVVARRTFIPIAFMGGT